MRKNYVYLLFALFFAFSACQEEDVQSTVEEDIEEVEPITFTFIYKGKTYLETRSSETDLFQNKTIEDVLSTNDYSIFFDQKQKNTAYLFDNSEDAKSFFKASFSNSNARCSDEGNRGELVLWRDKSFEPAEKLIKYPNGDVVRVVDASGSVRFKIDNYSNTSTPESILVPDLSVSPYKFNDKTSSVQLYNFATSGTDFYVSGCEREAVAILYVDTNYRGKSIVLTTLGGVAATGISNLSKGYFYDFFGIKYGPTYNDKFSSIALYFN